MLRKTNFFLQFKNRAYEAKYHEELCKSVSVSFYVSISLLAFNVIGRDIVTLIIDRSSYTEHLAWHITRLSVLIVLNILLGVVSKKIKPNLAFHCFKNMKIATWLLDGIQLCFCCGLAVTCIFLPFGHLMDNDSLLYLNGYSLGLQICVCSLILFNWMPRCLFFAIICIIVGTRNLQSAEANKWRIADILLNVLMLSTVTYLVEKNIARRKFLTFQDTSEISNTCKNIIKKSPDGYLILGKRGEEKFSNDSLKKMVFQKVASLPDLSPALEALEGRKITIEDFEKFQNVQLSFVHADFQSNSKTFIFERKPELEVIMLLHSQFNWFICSIQAEASNRSDPNEYLSFDGSVEKPLNQTQQYQSLASLLKEFLNTWNEYNPTLPNGEIIMQLSTSFPSEDKEAEKERAFDVKLWTSKYMDDEQVIVMMVSETSQQKQLATFKNRDLQRSRLLASFSHEMRTPLNGSNNLLERALVDPSPSKEVKEKYLMPALRSNLLLLNLANDILDLSQIQARKLRLNFTFANVEETVRESIQLVELQAQKKRLRLVTEFMLSKSFEPFSTDHSRFKQILLNLLSNAIKFTQKGYVKVVVSEIAHSIGSCSSPRLLSIEVFDTGIGLSEPDKKKLFQAYTHIDNGNRANINPYGVGLGLTIANALSKSLGPSNAEMSGIKIDSKLNYGSKFSFIVEEKTFNNVRKSKNLMRQRTEFDSKLSVNQDFLPPDLYGMLISPTSAGVNLNLQKRRENSNQKEKFLSWSRSLRLPSGDKDLDNMCFDSQNDMEDMSTIPFENEVSPFYLEEQRNRQQAILKRNRETRRSHDLIKVSAKDFEEPRKCSCAQVLIVDDDPYNILAIETILDRLKVSFDSCFNGKEVISKVLGRAQSTKCSVCKMFSLIFMDCHMPIMDGFKAAAELKSLMRSNQIQVVPLVACTGISEQQDVRNILESGFDDYCVKPLSFEEALKILKKYDIH